MKQFNYTDNDRCYINDENTSYKIFNKAKITELATLLGLETVTYDADTMIFLPNSSSLIAATNLTAIKYDDDLSFFFVFCASGIMVYPVTTNFYGQFGILYTKTALSSVYRIDYAKASNAIVFTGGNSATSSDGVMAISKCRDINGDWHSAMLYRIMGSSNIVSYYNNIIESTVFNPSINNTFNTLISLQKIVMPTLQIVFDHVWVCTHGTNADFTPKRFLLNNTTWLYTGGIANAPQYGLYFELDE